jgi:glycosyltransferase involved in cell wall biosynthesis
MIYIIMTAYDEAESLRTLLPRIPDQLFGADVTVIVMDDGSTDETADVAGLCGSIVVRGRTNRGKGASLQHALRIVADTEFDAVVLMDADGQHDPIALENMAAPVLNREADIVIGSRYLSAPGRRDTPRNRYVVRLATMWILRRVFEIDCTDPFSGYRAFSPEAVRGIELRGDRYETELETLFWAKRTGLRVAEHPIGKIYGPATSKMGARGGAFVGRVKVIAGYARAILDAARDRDTRDAPAELHHVS